MDVSAQSVDQLREQIRTLEIQLRELEAQRRDAERYRAVVEDQSELICRFRPDGVLTFVNGACCRTFGRERDDLLGTSFRPPIAEQDRQRYEQHLASLKPEHPGATIELRLLDAGGEERWHQLRDRALFDDEGRLLEIQSVGRDLTGQRRDHGERRQASSYAGELADLGRFARGIAHDFNNLLVGILGNAGLALMDLSPFSPCRPLIQEVEKAAQRAAALANQMLVESGEGMARATAGPVAAAAPEQADWRGEGTVLVVDDEEMVRTLAQRILEKFGFKVMTAGNGPRAVQIYRAHAAELRCVLLDMTMPGMSGEETFRELKRIRVDAKVLLSSGYKEQEATRHFAGLGLAGFIQKPYLPTDLIDKVRRVVDQE